MHNILKVLFYLCFFFFLFVQETPAEEYFLKLKQNLLSYFPAISGKVVKVENNQVYIDKGLKEGIKKGQRIILFEQTAPLIHPVTRQVIGKSEKVIGSAEITDVSDNQAKALLIDGKIDASKEVLFKIPKTRVKILFAQGNTEWAVGEAYYRELKDTERFELLDAPVNLTDLESLFKDAKGADILLLLKPSKQDKTLKISQELYWIKDKKFLSSSEIELTQTAMSEMRKKYASLIVPEGHTLLSFRLSRSINRVASGNFDGISPNQVLIASDNEISLYLIDVDLKLKSNYSLPVGGDILWFDTGDIDKDGKDEIAITFKKDDRVISSIIKWTGEGFQEIARFNNLFVRIYDGRLIAQSYSPTNGFDGEIYYIMPQSSSFQKTDILKLPVKANIYDFYVFGDTIFKWDEHGCLVVYNNKGVPLWRSQESMGFGQEYEKQSGIPALSLGKWKIHTKIKPLGNGIIVINKKPLLGLVNVSLLGYKSSKLQLIQWSGIGIEQTDITEEMSGEILDYSVASDRLLVLVKPPFGMSPKRLLMGESPFETILHILSFKY